MKRNNAKRIVMAMALVAFISVVFVICSAVAYFETGENLPAVDWLPDSASNVSFYRSYSFTAYEFDISEAEFLKEWSHLEFSPIDKPVGIDRYCLPTMDFPDFVSDATEAEQQEYWATVETPSAKISDGLYYEHVQRNGGGLWIAYDRQRGRAFINSAPR